MLEITSRRVTCFVLASSSSAALMTNSGTSRWPKLRARPGAVAAATCRERTLRDRCSRRSQLGTENREPMLRHTSHNRR